MIEWGEVSVRWTEEKMKKKTCQMNLSTNMSIVRTYSDFNRYATCFSSCTDFIIFCFQIEWLDVRSRYTQTHTWTVKERARESVWPSPTNPNIYFKITEKKTSRMCLYTIYPLFIISNRGVPCIAQIQSNKNHRLMPNRKN